MTDAGAGGGVAAGADPAPLFRALRDVEEHVRSGRLQLVSGRELRQLRFLGGAIADASSDVAGERLGDVLVRHGLLSQTELDGAIEIVLRARKRLGPVLAERGLLTEARIREGIGHHALEVVLAALRHPGLTVAFEELPENQVEADFACPLTAAQLVLDVSRRVDLAHVSRALAAEEGHLLAPAGEDRLCWAGLALSTAEGFVLSRIDGTQRAADIASVIPLGREEFERSLYGLLATGLVRFLEPRAPLPPRRREAPEAPTPAPIAAASLRPPDGSAPPPNDLEERRRSILEAHRGLDRTHYEVLGIGQDASAADVRGAYARLMRTFHPDVICAPELADVERQRQAVCLRAGEAYEVLKDAEGRAAYDNTLKLWRRKVPTPAPAAVPPPRPPEPPLSEPPTAEPPLPVAAPPASGSPPFAAAEGPAPPADPPSAPDAPPDEEDEHLAAIAAAAKLVEDCEFWDAIRMLEPLLPRLSGPRRARARMVLAEAYANNPKWRRRAEEALRSAIEDSPRDVQPRLMLARLYADLGLPARAAALYREVLEADPGNPTARQAVGATEPLGAGRGSGILGRLFRRP